VVAPKRAPKLNAAPAVEGAAEDAAVAAFVEAAAAVEPDDGVAAVPPVNSAVDALAGNRTALLPNTPPATARATAAAAGSKEKAAPAPAGTRNEGTRNAKAGAAGGCLGDAAGADEEIAADEGALSDMVLAVAAGGAGAGPATARGSGGAVAVATPPPSIGARPAAAHALAAAAVAAAAGTAEAVEVGAARAGANAAVLPGRSVSSNGQTPTAPYFATRRSTVARVASSGATAA